MPEVDVQVNVLKLIIKLYESSRDIEQMSLRGEIWARENGIDDDYGYDRACQNTDKAVDLIERQLIDIRSIIELKREGAQFKLQSAERRSKSGNNC